MEVLRAGWVHVVKQKSTFWFQNLWLVYHPWGKRSTIAGGTEVGYSLAFLQIRSLSCIIQVGPMETGPFNAETEGSPKQKSEEPWSLLAEVQRNVVNRFPPRSSRRIRDLLMPSFWPNEANFRILITSSAQTCAKVTSWQISIVRLTVLGITKEIDEARI